MKTSQAAASIDAMRGAAAEATALLSALANENRLLLLCQLRTGEKSVSELEELLDIHQPTLSQQIKQLALLRVAVGVLGERSTPRWWTSSFCGNNGKDSICQTI